MGIRAGELNNLVRIHPRAEERDEYGDVPTAFAPPVGPHWMSISPEAGGLRAGAGPGEEPVSAAVARSWSAVPVSVRDVLEVTAGPEAGAWYEVLAVFAPDAMHREIKLAGYTGPRPEAP